MKNRVAFKVNDSRLQKVFDMAEKAATVNIDIFGKYRVMTEGTLWYPNVWPETQPMAGEMYAKRDLEIGKNNCEIFMDFQRADGRLPGMISKGDGNPVPFYGWMQGFYFAMPALKMYYHADLGEEYLKKLYHCLKNFDAYLWKYRDSDGDGCLESWCRWDTGEDESTRYGDAENYFEGEVAPEGKNNVPMESMEYMAYSYANRDVLARISAILKNGEEEMWKKAAEQVADKVASYLWREDKHACFDRKADNSFSETLCHNTLRVMYFGVLKQASADVFLREHLFNPEEFFTPMPLTSIAINDPAFRNNDTNDWSGQPEGLTYQRSITALGNYGHFAEIIVLGKKFLEAVSRKCVFTQQFDPYTGEQPLSKDNGFITYGPTIITTLEYIAQMYGVFAEIDKMVWTVTQSESLNYSYSQEWKGRNYILKVENGTADAYVDGQKVFSVSGDCRIVTDFEGNVLKIIGTDEKEQKVTVEIGEKQYSVKIRPNMQMTLDNGNLNYCKEIEFAYRRGVRK